ncbi:hypothetical protein ZIOFF_064906 [Zingiber officinale]|uniref:Uncharacterized protein n=1 Tax=Zingiber officinale TaxID=94328 RepID=A0A8J5EZB8_ZINOF|nr:hypothetical protein ZIOFF_064906 [Zingiber officinale]
MVVLGDPATTGFSRLHAFCTSTGRQRSDLCRRKYSQPDRFHLIRGGLTRWHDHGLSVSRVLVPKLPAVSKGQHGSLVEELDSLEVYPKIIHFFRRPLLHDNAVVELLRQVQAKVSGDIVEIKTEVCFNIGVDGDPSKEKLGALTWLLQETFEPENLQAESFLEKEIDIDAGIVIVEVGALTWLLQETFEPENLQAESFHEKEVDIDTGIVIVEVGPPMSFTTAWSTNAESTYQACSLIVVTLKVTTFHTCAILDPVIVISVIERGRQALEEINVKMGLSFDEQDIQYYTRLFRDDIKRNPTTVELFDVVHIPVALKGFAVSQLRPVSPGLTCPLDNMMPELDVLFTAETHNFPCAIAPYRKAETGAGDSSFTYPSNLATPLQILVSASDGASDYGNKFGEPLIQGYTRTFGMRLPNGERREWLKPMMFSGGIGQIDHAHISKGEPEVGMLVVKIGGPA